MTPSAAARDWIERGYLPIPIPFRSKRPVLDRWPELRIVLADVPKYFNGAPQNISVLLGEPYGTADIDLDCTEALTAAATLAPDTGLIFGRASKPASHRFYRSDPPMPSRKYLDPTDKACLCELRCLKADGSIGMQTVVPGSVHEHGEEIRFEAGFDREAANVDGDVLQRAVALTAAAALLARHWPPAGHGRHECELALAGCLARAGWSIDDAERFVLATYRSVPNHDRTKFDRVRASVLSSFAKKNIDLPTTGFTKLSAAVGDAVARAATSWLGLPADLGRAAASQAGTQQRDFLCNETGNADRLFQRYGGDLAHCEQREGYMVWTGSVWRFDKFVLSERMAEETMREALSDAGNITDDKVRGLFLKFVSGSLSRKGLANMAHLSKKKVRQVETTDFDKDPFLLNCQNGTLNLHSGELRHHRKDDLLSKMISRDYDPAAECPQFRRFLYRIMGDGPDASGGEQETAGRLVAYLQRLFGCAATGKPEKLLVVFYGPTGDNGKTTLLTIINKALGDKEYTAQVNIGSLMVDPRGAGMSNAVNSDLSDLQGCRFVFSSEVERGQRLALSRVKYLTGLTSIKARRLRENWIEFTPTWKIFMDCNDRPVISSPTDAIWNRVKCVPFTVKLSKDEIDTDLGSKLEAELPGILTWIVAGAREYVAHGLGSAPPEVDASTEEYRKSSDRLKDFLEDCCHLNPYAWVSSERLSQAYTDWCGKNGERFPLDHNNFVEQIKLKGCVPKSLKIQGKLTRGWSGIELNC